jgi:hypothetical protein
MVALVYNSATLPKHPLRVRAQNHTYRLGAAICSRSNSQAYLRVATYAECNRLESCSKDPIKYAGGLSLYVYVDGNPNSWTDLLGLSRTRPGSPLLTPNHQQHHLFPQQHRGLIEGLCNGLVVDDLTMEVVGPMRVGTEHYHWQHGPCGNYNRDVKSMLDQNPGDCYGFMTDMLEYIHNRAACVARQLGLPTIRPITTQPWGDPRGPNNWDPSGLLDNFCKPICNKPAPPNPNINVIPWWVPAHVENDIYQDTGVVVGCVVVGVIEGEAIIMCCPAGAPTALPAAGNCITRKVGQQIIQDFPLTLAP